MEHNENKVSQPEGNVNTTTTNSAPKLWRNSRNDKTHRMVLLGVLSALVIVLQLWGSAIPFLGGTSLCLVLIPIVVGGLILGVKAGAFLGLLFGTFVFVWCGVLGYDPFTAFLFQSKPLITALICIVKGGVAGLVPPLVHRALSRKTALGSVFAAAALSPICNTGIFIAGMFSILGTLESYLSGAMSIGYFFGAIILVNFSVELVINLIASPAIYRVAQVVTRKKFH
jgi:uncharacterized membrane protein